MNEFNFLFHFLISINSFYHGNCKLGDYQIPMNSYYRNTKEFDTTLNGLILKNEKSIVKNVGDIYPHLDLSIESIKLNSYFYNQLLICHHELGGGRNSIDKFTVYYKNYINIHNYIKCKYKNFYTESGVQLSMSLNKFKHIKWFHKCIRIVKNEKIIFKLFSEYWNYRAYYIFYNNKLIKFSFGYDTP